MSGGMQTIEQLALARASNVPFRSYGNGASPDPERYRRMPPRTRWQRFVAARARTMRKVWRRLQRWWWAI